jgi:hypothetical protein
MSFALFSVAILWIYYLERETKYAPIMRLSIVTRNKGRVGVVYYVGVSSSRIETDYMLKRRIFARLSSAA